jgi:hypothetical protein
MRSKLVGFCKFEMSLAALAAYTSKIGLPFFASPAVEVDRVLLHAPVC